MAGATHCVVSAALMAALPLIDLSPGTAVLILSGAVALGAAVILAMSRTKADREAKNTPQEPRCPTASRIVGSSRSWFAYFFTLVRRCDVPQRGQQYEQCCSGQGCSDPHSSEVART